jgi:hypothetical protein
VHQCAISDEAKQERAADILPAGSLLAKKQRVKSVGTRGRNCKKQKTPGRAARFLSAPRAGRLSGGSEGAVGPPAGRRSKKMCPGDSGCVICHRGTWDESTVETTAPRLRVKLGSLPIPFVDHEAVLRLPHCKIFAGDLVSTIRLDGSNVEAIPAMDN